MESKIEILNISGDKINRTIKNDKEIFTIIKNKIFYIDAKITPKITKEMGINVSTFLDIKDQPPIPSLTNDICTVKSKFDKHSGIVHLNLKLNLLSRNYQNNNFILLLTVHRNNDLEDVICSTTSDSIRVISKEPKNTNKRKLKEKTSNEYNNKKKKAILPKMTPSNDSKENLENKIGSVHTTNSNNLLLSKEKLNTQIKTTQNEFPKSPTINTPTLNNYEKNEQQSEIKSTPSVKFNEDSIKNNSHQKNLRIDSLPSSTTSVPKNPSHPSTQPSSPSNHSLLDEINHKQDRIISLLEDLGSTKQCNSTAQTPKDSDLHNALFYYLKMDSHPKSPYPKSPGFKIEEPESLLHSPAPLSPYNPNNLLFPSIKMLNSFKEFVASFKGIPSNNKILFLSYLFKNFCTPQERNDFALSIQESNKKNSENELTDLTSLLNCPNSNSFDAYDSFFNLDS